MIEVLNPTDSLILIEMQAKIDSLTLITAATEKSQQPFSFSDVKSFYEDSWNKLTWTIGIMIGIVGILVPIFTNLFQRRSFENERKSIIDSISENNKNNLSFLMEEKIDDYLGDFLDEIEFRANHNQGHVFSLQAILLKNEKEYYDGFSSMLISIDSFISAGITANTLRAFKELIEDYLPNVKNYETLLTSMKSHGVSIEDLKKTIEDNDAEDITSDYMLEIENHLSKIEKSKGKSKK